MNPNKTSFCSADSEELSLALGALRDEEKEVAEEAIGYYLSFDSDIEFAFAFSGEALLVRVFDLGRYFFIFPSPLSDCADIPLAIEETVRYCILEEIEPIFAAVPSDEIGVFASLGYRHINFDADSPDAQEYRVTLKNELSLLDEAPEAEGELISLSPLRESDAKPYAELCRDEKTNEFMGYDWREDYPDADEKTFFEVAARELNYCSALTLAVRLGEVTVGDVAIHNLDYRGGADISIRILPERRRQGYAREVLSLSLDIAQEMGLTRLYARVDNRNLPSLSLFSADASTAENQGDITVFTYEIV